MMLEKDVALRSISLPNLPFFGNGAQVLHGQRQGIVGDLLLKNACISWSMSPQSLQQGQNLGKFGGFPLHDATFGSLAQRALTYRGSFLLHEEGTIAELLR